MLCLYHCFNYLDTNYLYSYVLDSDVINLFHRPFQKVFFTQAIWEKINIQISNFTRGRLVTGTFPVMILLQSYKVLGLGRSSPDTL